MKQLQKIVSILMAIFLMLGQVTPMAQAFDVPTPPTAPTAPPAPTAPAAEPTAPPAPTAPPTPSLNDTTTTPTTTPEPTHRPHQQEEPTPSPSATPTSTEESTTQNSDSTDSQDGSGNVGDTVINTGSATTNANGDTSANNNVASGVSGDASPSIRIGNTGNGSESTNEGSANINNTNTTLQNNTSTVVSGMGLSSDTGDNEASKNVGDSTISTGDANVSGTLITNVNSNVDAVMVSEFNIVDDHIGDIVLDFAANCISGCSTGGMALSNTENGADSTNTTNLDTNSTNETFQNNDATVENSMILKANSGDNEADKNTGGDSTISTGDANINANMLTFANNNIAGNVIYGIVNIYGNLVGDILMPEELLANCCGTGADLSNTNNGSGSNNATNYALNDTNESFQTNIATIDNTLILDVNSGDNEASKNTGGNSDISTGDTSIDANVLTVANTNLDGGTWWLVLVNEAGEWVGRILGADGDAPFAGSEGTKFAVAQDGAITVSNSGNGADSTNTGSVNQTNTDTTVQNNTANVSNVMDLSANTGGNSTSKNTGGNNRIETGDATVIANIVNFVNNNMIGNGKLLVTVVNVFGSWLGDLVTPGSHKETASTGQQETIPAVGGTDVSPSTQNDSQKSQITLQAEDSDPVTYTGTLPSGNTISFAAGSSSQTMVLASTITNLDAGTQNSVAGRKTVHINLAWLILLLPCAIILFAIKKLRKT